MKAKMPEKEVSNATNYGQAKTKTTGAIKPRWEGEKEMQVKYKELKTSLGRNGYMQTSGIDIYGYSEFVELVPVTSKGGFGRCSIQLPQDAEVLEAVAAELMRHAAALKAVQP